MSVTKPWWERLISKTSLANLTATILVVGGLSYAYATQNNDLMIFMVGAGVGYLFGAKPSPVPPTA